jgi:GNAT superfamily N-acetyltransferase
MAEVTFEWIEGTDPRMEAVQAVIEQRGWTPLNFQTCRAYCAFEPDGTLVGFSIFQLFPMVGPFFVDPSYRATGIAETLADDTAAFLHECNTRGYIAIADSPHSEKLCKGHGMKLIDAPVYLMAEGKA